MKKRIGKVIYQRGYAPRFVRNWIGGTWRFFEFKLSDGKLLGSWVHQSTWGDCSEWNKGYLAQEIWHTSVTMGGNTVKVKKILLGAQDHDRAVELNKYLKDTYGNIF